MAAPREPCAFGAHIPGATLADATFLSDGRIALNIAIPERESTGTVGSWREAWVLDPVTGGVGRFETPGFAAPRSPVLVVSRDGRRVAYLQQAPPRPDQAIAQGSPLDEVWVASADGGSLVRVFALAPVARAGPYGSPEVERLIDLEWAQDGRRVLVATRIGEPLSGPVRGRLLVLEAIPLGGGGSVTAPVELVTMPATIVPRSYSWGPDGRWVAFLARASAAPVVEFDPHAVNYSPIANPTPFDDDLQPKPAYFAMLQVLHDRPVAANP